MNTPQHPLSVRLREGTKKAHRAVENLTFVRAFLRGVISVDSYCRYLVDLEHVYAKLEQSLCCHRHHPMVRPLLLPELFRHQSLLSDLAFFCRQQCVPDAPSESARRYSDYLCALCEEHPELLPAHAYTRYLGDLSGGQILGRIVARAFNLPGNEGLRFYVFPQIADLAQFKTLYRARLDKLPVDEELTQRLVAEAICAFNLNGAILHELSGSALRALWKLITPSPHPSIELA